MIRPKDLVRSTLLIIYINLVTLSMCFSYLCLDPIIINSVLATFKLNLLALSQQLKVTRSSGVNASLSSVKVFAVRVILVSSANILREASRRQLGISLIYIKNSKGLNMLPCETPQVIVRGVDSLPLTLHIWVRLLRYD